jgi:hypothetical protein
VGGDESAEGSGVLAEFEEIRMGNAGSAAVTGAGALDDQEFTGSGDRERTEEEGVGEAIDG